MFWAITGLGEQSREYWRLCRVGSQGEGEAPGREYEGHLEGRMLCKHEAVPGSG